MSTNYHLLCEECNEAGGYFSRQAWGWGNSDLIENTIFMMQHADCNNKYQSETAFRIVSEYDHDTDAEQYLNWGKTLLDPDSVASSAFPKSNDWAKAEKGNIREWWESEGRSKTIEDIYRFYGPIIEEREKRRQDKLDAIERIKKMELEAYDKVKKCVELYGSHDYWPVHLSMTFAEREATENANICQRCGATPTGAIIY